MQQLQGRQGAKLTVALAAATECCYNCANNCVQAASMCMDCRRGWSAPARATSRGQCAPVPTGAPTGAPTAVKPASRTAPPSAPPSASPTRCPCQNGGQCACQDPPKPLAALPAPFKDWSCTQWRAVYGGTCDVDAVKASTNCDASCQQDPGALRRRCPRLCNACPSAVSSSSSSSSSRRLQTSSSRPAADQASCSCVGGFSGPLCTVRPEYTEYKGLNCYNGPCFARMALRE